MKTPTIIAIYAFAMVAANLTVAHFGPWISPINAALFIGLDMTVRDLLHLRLGRWQMGALIASTGMLTYALNPAAGSIALGSSLAFALAAGVDWLVFSRARGTWVRRSMVSNVAGAAVDSLVFPLVAFGGFLPAVVALQFAAKVGGGAVWALVLDRWQRRRTVAPV